MEKEKTMEWIIELNEDETILEARWVRELVRCKDCKWWKTIHGFCDFKFCTYVIGADFVRKEDDFCSRGEREDDVIMGDME